MKTNLRLLKVLKKKLTLAEDFHQVLEYFFNHFGENPNFIKMGTPTQHPILEQILAQVGAEVVGGPVAIKNLFLVALPKHQFVHGGCTLNGRIVTLFYFEDIQKGLLAVATLGATETKIVRFTGYILPGKPRVALN